MKIKKILLVSLMGAGMLLSACGGEPAEPQYDIKGNYDVTLWVSDVAGVKELTEQQIKNFEKENEGVVINATVEKVSEASAATQMLTDVTEGADIFCFAQDQFARLVQGGALAKLGKGAANTVKELNDAGSVNAVKSGADLYAYPMTSDNGYFMYYDKSVITNEAHLENLEDLIADCEAAGRKFSMELQTSAWYMASFFFGTGCVSEWQTNSKGKFVAYNDTFNSDKGVVAAKGMKKLLDSSAHTSSSSVNDFTAATPSAIVVSGTWAYNDAAGYLGENLGTAKLPSFTVDGQKYQMGSYSGYKLMGVKPSEDPVRAACMSKLALYLTNAKSQEERFDAVAWGPSNKAVQAMDKVTANPGLKALAAQSPFSFPQGQIHGGWWDMAKVVATDVKAASDEAGIRAALEKYQQGMDDLLTIDPDSWIFVGAWNGWTLADKNSTYYAQETEEPGVYTLTLTVEQSDYMGGRFCHPVEWKSDWGCTIVDAESKALIAEDGGSDNNIVFLAPGNYTLTFDTNVPSIHIVKNS